MSELLIRAQELQALLHEPDIIIFDVRHDLHQHRLGRQQYLQAHIPGAYFLDNEAELVGKKTGTNGRHPLPDLAVFSQLMQQYGLKPDTPIVVYDASQAHMAARTWWLLRWAGFERVRILDGGWQAWLAAGGVTDTQLALPPVPRTRKLGMPEPKQPTVTASQILAQLAQPRWTLIDARAEPRYRGEMEPIDPVAGHIPGALNRPTAFNLQEDGCFKQPQQLRAEFEQLLGNIPAEQVVHYCGSGITACHNLFAMELAGLSGSVLYPGSWSEWITDASRPRATAQR